MIEFCGDKKKKKNSGNDDRLRKEEKSMQLGLRNFNVNSTR
jgi:hypothetical protein